ncbi:DUF3093 domain-containing protein [Rothia terrae]|uniref:DUF3093 domain-containing protein n=1 Tax=Rothia terrae TaxID=396015 RepID=A0A7H2BBK6_9MICC|nr:DUF3093 domain-containing protein [Rothia terrae]MDT0190218.1 DUF3093 domain-containing protein [Rothia terrae]QNV37052.1 DUF3093 domain-containing protein [Rothia terrae]
MSTSTSSVLYQERLTPSTGLWVGVLGAGVASFLVGAPINIMAGVIAGVIVAVLLGFILYSSSPTITITDDILRVGRAAIEREHVGVAEGFRGEASRVISGPELDGRAFMCFRGWIEPKVRIQITDKADPTPYWIASTRHPERIVEILNENIGDSELERYQQEMQREHEQRMLLTHEARSQAQES